MLFGYFIHATFAGRASRTEFWRWVLVFVLLTLVTRMIDGALFASSVHAGLFERSAMQPLTFIAILALLLPNMALAVRRLHDTGRSGWWLLLMLVPDRSSCFTGMSSRATRLPTNMGE